MVDKWMIRLIKLFVNLSLVIWMRRESMKFGCPLTDEKDISN